MKIQRLYIKQYNNLKDFVFEPSQTEPTTVILGRNGAGKSNLIEAIVEIFRDLESFNASSFYYEIEYACYNNNIKGISINCLKKCFFSISRFFIFLKYE